MNSPTIHSLCCLHARFHLLARLDSNYLGYANRLRLARLLVTCSRDLSHRLFVMKSTLTPKGWKYDHIGFVLDSGDLKDMSGHRYKGDKPMNPVKYSWEQIEKVFNMPDTKQEAIKNNLYAETKLPHEVAVPEKAEKAINCTSFVKLTLMSQGIPIPKTNKPFDIFQFYEKQ